jgi:hypothetical protein
MKSSRKMQERPRSESFHLRVEMFSKISCNVFKMAGSREGWRTSRPRRFFNWLTAMVTEAAEVKPEMTGDETKSTKNPERKIWNFKNLDDLEF